MHVYYRVAFCLGNFSSKSKNRQGAPFVPYLFLLFVLNREKQDIRGIVICDKEHKISQYADDITVTLEGS